MTSGWGLSSGARVGPGLPPALCRGPVPAFQRGSCPFPRALLLDVVPGWLGVPWVIVSLGPHGS